MIAISASTSPYSRRFSFMADARARLGRRLPRFARHDAALSVSLGSMSARLGLGSPRTMARMIFSWVASLAAISPDDPSLVHDIDAVADAKQFRHFRGDHQDGLALVGQPVDDRVDFIFGADVDAARRFVEDQHLRIGEQPLRQHDLLLVAAGQVAGHLVDAGRADVGLLAVVVGDVEFAHVVDHAGRSTRPSGWRR